MITLGQNSQLSYDRIYGKKGKNVNWNQRKLDIVKVSAETENTVTIKTFLFLERGEEKITLQGVKPRQTKKNTNLSPTSIEKFTRFYTFVIR